MPLRLAAFQIARRQRPAVWQQTLHGDRRQGVGLGLGRRGLALGLGGLALELLGEVVDAVVVAQGAQPGVPRRRRVVELDLAHGYGPRDALRVRCF